MALSFALVPRRIRFLLRKPDTRNKPNGKVWRPWSNRDAERHHQHHPWNHHLGLVWGWILMALQSRVGSHRSHWLRIEASPRFKFSTLGVVELHNGCAKLAESTEPPENSQQSKPKAWIFKLISCKTKGNIGYLVLHDFVLNQDYVEYEFLTPLVEP